MGFAGCGGGGEDSKAPAASRRPAPPVVVAEVKRQPVPLEVRAFGNVEPYSSIEIKSRVSGPLVRVHFEEGQDVRKGQVLFEIAPRAFLQAERQAEAELASKRAALSQAQANYERDLARARKARAQAQRYADLATKGIITHEENDQHQTRAVAAERVAAATKTSIAVARASVQYARAKLRDGRLKLDHAIIRAPISGRTGELTLKAGNFVAADANIPLVVINQITPAYATFSVPEHWLNEVRRYSPIGVLQVHALPQAGAAPVEGTLDSLDNAVSRSSGRILLKARFPNQDLRLWPGQFINVAMDLAVPAETVVPAAAVRSGRQGSYVFVVTSDSTAEQRSVQTVRTWRDVTVIAGGVSPGECVVVEGYLRVTPGAEVQIVPRSGTSDTAGARSKPSQAAEGRQ